MSRIPGRIALTTRANTSSWRAADELDFLFALDRLVPIDEVRRIDDAALAGEALLQSRCEGMRDSTGIHHAHGSAPAMFDLVEGELRVVALRVLYGEQ